MGEMSGSVLKRESGHCNIASTINEIWACFSINEYALLLQFRYYLFLLHKVNSQSSHSVGLFLLHFEPVMYWMLFSWSNFSAFTPPYSCLVSSQPDTQLDFASLASNWIFYLSRLFLGVWTVTVTAYWHFPVFFYSVDSVPAGLVGISVQAGEGEDFPKCVHWRGRWYER